MGDFFIHIASAIKLATIGLIVALISIFSPATAKPPPVISTEPVATTSEIRTVAATSTKPETPPKISTASTTPPAPITNETKQTPLPPVLNPIVATSTPTIIPEWDTINERARAAVVNIICTSQSAGLMQPLSGSGVFIDPKGIILTNAHIAQYWLIKDYPSKDYLDCVIRQDSPASPRYRAKLVYISPTWIKVHYTDLLTQDPLGTGENDYALLLVNTTTGPSISLPTSFPYLPPATTDTENILGQPVLMAAYPAGFLGGVSIQTTLFMSSAPGAIQGVYTFTDTRIDVLSLGGNVVAQHGSSGGAVVTGDGKLRGIIVTTSEADTTATRDLHAITISYINRRFTQETGVTLPDLLASDVYAVADEFNETLAPTLTKLLTQSLIQTTH